LPGLLASPQWASSRHPLPMRCRAGPFGCSCPMPGLMRAAPLGASGPSRENAKMWLLLVILLVLFAAAVLLSQPPHMGHGGS
jgi:hypothetical protein